MSDAEQSLVDARLDEFVAALRRGERPRPETLVQGLSEPARQLMLREAFLEQREFEREKLDSALLRSFSEFASFSESDFLNDAGLSSPNSESKILPVEQLPRLANYELLQVLGTGGTARVFLASHHRLRRLVALKCPLTGAQAMSSEQLVSLQRRFQREARIQAQVASPGVPVIFEVDWTLDELPLIAMEPVLGPTLEQQLRDRSPAPLDRIHLEHVARVCRTLTVAHRQGVLHLDLKPQNIRFTADGFLKILDWGFGREPKEKLAEQAGIDGREDSLFVTQLGGTPYYMAPEQARGDWDSLTDKTDSFAIGAILYEVLTGRRIFPLDSSTEELISWTSNGKFDDALVYLQGCGLPDQFIQLGSRCLSMEQDDRPAVDEIARTIEGYFAEVDEADRQLREEALVLKANQKRLETERKLRARNTLVAVAALFSVLLLGTLFYVGYLWKNAESLQQVAETAQAHAESAEKAERIARGELVKADAIRRVALAYEKWKEREVGLARELLQDCPPELRNWEWQYVHRLCHPEKLSIAAHRGAVFAVALNRRRIISCGLDGFVRGWDARDGKQVYEIPFPRSDGNVHWNDQTRFAVPASVSPDAKRIATVTEDSNIQIWDGDTGEKLRLISLPRDEKQKVSSLAIDTRAEPLLVVVRGFSCWLYHPESGELITQLPAATSVSIASPTLRIAGIFDFFSWSGSIFDVREKQVIKAIKRDVSLLSNMKHPTTWVVSPLGTEYIEFGEYPFEATVRDFQNDQVKFQLVGHEGPVLAIAYAPFTFGTGWRLASASQDGTAKFWAGSDGRLLANLVGHQGPVVSIAFDPSGKQIITGGDDGQVKVWRPDSVPREISQVFGDLEIRNQQAIEHLTNEIVSRQKVYATSPDGTKIIRSGFVFQNDSVFDARTGKTITELPFKQPVGQGVRFSDSGRLIVRAAAPANEPVKLEVYSSTTGELRNTLPLESTGSPNLLRLSPDDSQILLTSGLGTLNIWNLNDNSLVVLSELPEPDAWYTACFSRDGTKIAASSSTGRIFIFDAIAGRELASTPLDAPASGDLEFVDDGQALVNISLGGRLQKWSVDSLEKLLDVATVDAVGRIKVDQARGRIAVAHGREISIFSLETGEAISRLVGHSNRVRAIDFNSDGTRLVSGGDDQDLYLWDIDTGVQTFRLRGHKGGVNHIIFGEADQWILSASYGFMEATDRALVWEAASQD